MSTFSNFDPIPEDFVLHLRAAIVALGEALPDVKSFLAKHIPKYVTSGGYLEMNGCFVMDGFITVADWIEKGFWPDRNSRSALNHAHMFTDNWMLPPDVPFTRLVETFDGRIEKTSSLPDLPPDGRVLDEAALAAIANYRAWRIGYDERERQEQEAYRAAREAAAGPKHRKLPHQPDPDSLKKTRWYADSAIFKREGHPGFAPFIPTTPAGWMKLAGSYLSRALIDHWGLDDPIRIHQDLREAASCVVAAQPSVSFHAWEYEQWQHLAIVISHIELRNALRSLRREDWDTNRIRPVNWLICRIRILNLLGSDGLDSEIRGLLEMSRIGLFDDPLPAELAVDTPLMQNWHHLLHAIVHRDVATFDRRLADRQTLLAQHWIRGGGIAPLSLADLGGLALVRTARQCGLTPAALDAPYLSLVLP